MPQKPTNVLTAREAEALRLCEDKGLTWSQAGEVLKVAPGTVQKAFESAQRKLKRVREAERTGAVVDGKWKSAEKKLGSVTDQMISERMDRMILKGLFYLENNPEIWARASVRELTQSISALTEKRQLLRGEATSIVRHEDVRTLDQALGMIQEEIRRRQNVVDADPVIGKGVVDA